MIQSSINIPPDTHPTLAEIMESVDRLASEGRCEWTMWGMVDDYLGDEYSRFELFKDYTEIGRSRGYPEFVVDRIDEELEFSGFCSIVLIPNPLDDHDFNHAFALCMVEDDRVFRVESYVDTYCSRLVEWPTYRGDLQRLLGMWPGVGRINYWNGLFSSYEERDVDHYPMDVELGGKYLVAIDNELTWRDRIFHMDSYPTPRDAYTDVDRYRSVATHLS